MIRTETDHNTGYDVFQSVESCDHPRPDDPAEYAKWEESHPEGEGINDCIQICMLTPIGTYCQECSQDNGDWITHRDTCPECECWFEDDGSCQCEPEASL